VSLTDPEKAPDQALRTPSNLQLRMIASVGMIAVASLALTLGGIAFWVLGVVAALFMMAECSRAPTPRPSG
jgi:membrane protein YqaA with SNARE-associated domain